MQNTSIRKAYAEPIRYSVNAALPGWNSVPILCWRPVDQMAEVRERDCHMMNSFGGTVHYGNEPAAQ